ncbi:uroporphyrinogen-III synthase [Shewanella putrefaciens]|uniref:uroporphyrinogen-III synthase n=1 Tax=Shewanella TaxID=22 RepID=UPI00005FC1EA|nr:MULTISPECIES: uroporphyrinogen-III synthase [Shewanella]ABM26533.1 Uroporphyrinogen III synthase HEM4 [Shewanella sp. W3-18-1]UXK09054.1 uroporphyrinogen-III synthase [Shewanella putrefaciens]
MKVLLTRPEGRNQSMVDALNARGIAHYVTPLLGVEPTNDITTDASHPLAGTDIIICISANAVIFANKALNKINAQIATWPKVQYFAVGHATWEALDQLGICAVEAPDDCQQTEGLLTLTSLQHIPAKKVTIIRGVGGREALAEQLTSRGANVRYWEVYQRVCPPLDGYAITQQWQHFGIDTIVVTSGEVLNNLIKLVPKELFAWLRSCHIIVPSNRVEAQAHAFGINHVTNACAANSKAVLNALKL